MVLVVLKAPPQTSGLLYWSGLGGGTYSSAVYWSGRSGLLYWSGRSGLLYWSGWSGLYWSGLSAQQEEGQSSVCLHLSLSARFAYWPTEWLFLSTRVFSTAEPFQDFAFQI